MLHRHWHAVQLDVMRLGYRKKDIFTTLSVDEMVSIVVAAPPNSAVFHAVNEGWTLTDHLLATAGEQQAGLVEMRSRVARPGLTDIRPSKPANVNDHSKPIQRVTFDSMTIDDFERRRAQRIKGGSRLNG